MKVTIYFTGGKALEINGMKPNEASDAALGLTDLKQVRATIPTGDGISFVPSRNVCMVEMRPESEDDRKFIWDHQVTKNE